MKQIIICGCENEIAFDREPGETKKVICDKCGAAFISGDKGYIYNQFG